MLHHKESIEVMLFTLVKDLLLGLLILERRRFLFTDHFNFDGELFIIEIKLCRVVIVSK